MVEGFDKSYQKFDFYVESAVEKLRHNEGWSDSKIAYYLREMAQSLSPRGRKTKKITIDPLKISEEEISKFPTEIQKKIRTIKLKMGVLQDLR